MRAAIYARVSTTDQKCDMQLGELREYVSRRGWELAGEYVDSGWSGASLNRPEFNRLMQDAAKRKFDVILCWKLDRFGRSLVHCSNALQQLKAHGVRFIATSQNIDTDESNPASRFLLHMLMAAAEFERELIRERSMVGQKRYRTLYEAGKMGKEVHSKSGFDLPIGRPRKKFDRQEVVELHEQGFSNRQIARKLKIGDGTVRRVLKERQNPVLEFPMTDGQSKDLTRQPQPATLAAVSGAPSLEYRDVRLAEIDTQIKSDDAARQQQRTTRRFWLSERRGFGVRYALRMIREFLAV